MTGTARSPRPGRSEIEDPHRPLREDIRLLGGLLGEAIRRHEGDAAFDLVERIRALSKEIRSGDELAFPRFKELIRTIPLGEAVVVVRAFSQFLALANVAEQHHRTRRRREYLRRGAAPQKASLEDEYRALLGQGVTAEELVRAVLQQEIDLVLTAHPTEIARVTLLEKYNHLAAILEKRDRPDLTDLERGETEQELRAEVTAIWLTDEIRRKAPTPIDEARSGLYIFQQTLWDVVPAFLRHLDGALSRYAGSRLPMEATPFRFSSWIGGDRDGNPFVTAEITRKVCVLSRLFAVDLYLREVEQLARELSLNPASAELLAEAGRDAHEPYRAVLNRMIRKLQQTRRHLLLRYRGRKVPVTGEIERAAELLVPLDKIHRSLVEIGAEPVASGRVGDLIHRVRAFGLMLAKLDIRQDSSAHASALAEISSALGLRDYSAMDESARLAFLRGELSAGRALNLPALELSAGARETVETFRVIAELGDEALGAYVISMAREASDVLEVELLQKWACVASPLRVVPLFETVEDLDACEAAMSELFRDPDYRRRSGGRQEVMVGYSDSAKTAGRFASAWSLYKAQEALGELAREHGFTLSLFHGRGGTVARGGGPTWLAVQSQPPGSLDGRMRVTEQGEMIQAKFGMPGIALRTLEVYHTVVLHSTLRPPKEPRPEWRETMERLARESIAEYRSVLEDTAGFAEYFRAATPEPELTYLNIGSRPKRRAKGGGVEGLRAIPWSFAWTQTRLMMPSWLGVAEAIEREIAAGGLEAMREMYREWEFFRSTIDLVQMVLAKASPRIAADYDAALVPAGLRSIGDGLRARFDRTIVAVLKVSGVTQLLETNPVLRRSIRVRNPYVDPINLLQIELLRRFRESGEGEPKGDPAILDALLRTFNGIANGMRNTG